MKTLCLTLPESPHRQQRVRQHLLENGISDVHFVLGLDAVKAGIEATHPYEVDNPGSHWLMGPKITGIFLGHYLVWTVCCALPDDTFLIVEDDVVLCHDWPKYFEEALAHVPPDWDVLFLGSCCHKGHPEKHISGPIYESGHWQCLHAYMVTKRAAQKMIETQRDWYGPVDALLVFHTFPHLKVYGVLPRIAEQLDTEIPP